MDIFSTIGSLFGYVLWFFYSIFNNYGIAIILFTIVVKLLMFPLSVKQQKSMAANSRLVQKQQDIRQRYANDQKKMNEEIQKMYEKEGGMPSMGCASMFLPLVILMGVYYAVVSPLTNTLHMDNATVTNALNQLTVLPGIGNQFTTVYGQLEIVNIATQENGKLFLAEYFNTSDIVSISNYAGSFDFLGLNLLGRPDDGFSVLIIIPILCFVTSFVSQIVTMLIQGTLKQQQGCMLIMFLTMPLFSAYIAYTVPAAVGFYWVISTLTGFVQTIVLQKFYSAKHMTAKQEAQRVALLREQEKNVVYSYNPRKRIDDNISGSKNNTKKKKK
ncbi:MAG: YidC/Oxa1 family membrane protein insertase [Acutalibacteraceae bacterium]|nr:YidC/Oxa1 family membrane protein insertase [Acutalibacteraceae bacterium]